jgi:uncharacterized membrane protein HdeD (DUF308 family)
MSVAPRRWTVIASGLLVLALGLVVMFTTQGAFLSPIALIVVAAIGLTALLFQVRFRQDLPNFRPPLALNVLGILCAVCALAADYLRMSHRTLELAAFATVACFGVSGLLILHALGRQRQPSP